VKERETEREGGRETERERGERESDRESDTERQRERERERERERDSEREREREREREKTRQEREGERQCVKMGVPKIKILKKQIACHFAMTNHYRTLPYTTTHCNTLQLLYTCTKEIAIQFAMYSKN